MTADIAVRVAELLTARATTLAVAESSTGGLILSLLTDVPGASRWLRGGLVAYTNTAKRDLLGVPAAALSTHGAVSPETALEMARGARRLFGAAWALGETGVAGPQTGRRSAKPAGLTFLAVAGERDGQPIERVKRHLLPTPGDRVATKRAFAEAALALLLDELQK
jgi:nicotinamide-nucleotide amidase